MKLINHKKDNYYHIDFAVMRGTITMTFKEYKNVIEYLSKEYKKAKKNIDTYTRDSLSIFSHYYGFLIKPEKIVCLGVVGTSLIAKKYGLKNYKDVNYGIKIVK